MTFLSALALAAVTWYPAADWVEKPDPVASTRARKGGTMRFYGANVPKSINAYIDNNTYTIMMFSMMYSPLISTDPTTMDFEPSLAKRWGVSDDGNEFYFEIDPRAKWSDGVPVSAYDVKWTFEAVLADKFTGHWKTTLGSFETPEILDADNERPLKIRFKKKASSSKNWRDLLYCGTFYVLPKHAFEKTDFDKIDFVNAPVGGPYYVSRLEGQVETEFSRVKDWWRANSPSCKNLYNFDKIIMRYYIDRTNGFAALKKGELDFFPVYSARIWAKESTGAAFDKNWLLKRRVLNSEPVGYQGFVMNMRNFPFDDVRVRKAMAMLINREMMNRTMMFNEYFMQNSFYYDLYDKENPCTNELVKYDPVAAAQLLAEAGFTINKDGILQKNGREFSFTFLSREAHEDKFLVHFNNALKKQGIKMSIVRKDFSNWMKDMDEFNFQMTWSAMGASVFRNPQIMWHSAEADRLGANNYSGFKSKVVDDLIEKEKSLQTQAERNAIYREIDRLVTQQHPYAFLWNIAAKRFVYWNKFGMPATIISRYNKEEDVLVYWWYDQDKAEELQDAMKNDTFLPSVPLKVEFNKVMSENK